MKAKICSLILLVLLTSASKGQEIPVRIPQTIDIDRGLGEILRNSRPLVRKIERAQKLKELNRSRNLDPQIYPTHGGNIPTIIIDLAEKLAVEGNESAIRLISHLDGYPADSCWDSAVKFLITKENNRLSRYEEFADDCEIETLLNKVADESKFANITNRIGVFVANHQVFCTGFLIDSSTISTARHCLTQFRDADDPTFELFMKNIAPVTDFEIAEDSCNGVHTETQAKTFQACDYVNFFVPEIMGLAQIQNNRSQSIDSILDLEIFGYNQYHHRYVDKEAHRNHSFDSWREGVVGSGSAICVSYQFNDVTLDGKHVAGPQCVLHGCQTIAGMSGSPIFVDSGDSLGLYGVHIGSTDFDEKKWEGRNKCGFEDTKPGKQMNIGVRLD